MMWTPESVKTGSLNSPTLSANAASSNGFCMAPFPNGPRSPLRFADEQSEYFCASSAKEALPATICSLYAKKREYFNNTNPLQVIILHFTNSSASSFVRVMFSSLHDEGLRESLCLTSKCEH